LLAARVAKDWNTVKTAALAVDSVVLVAEAEAPRDDEELQRSILAENRALREEVTAQGALLRAQGEAVQVSVSESESTLNRVNLLARLLLRHWRLSLL
jgi:hypothetical protein